MSRSPGGGAVEFIGSFSGVVPDTGLPEIAFAGRSNVGKSSALNCLFENRKAARTSGRPGRTQAINLFRAGGRLCIVDLPGYGFARVPNAVREQWRGMIDRYLSAREHLTLVVLLVDVRLEAQPMDLQLIAALISLRLPILVLATKIDKLSRQARIPQLRKLEKGLGLPADALVGFSAVSGEGKEEIWKRLELALAP